MHIWIVEDDFRIARIHTQYVQQHMIDARIQNFQTAHALKEALRTHELPAVILLDLYIPDVEGYELVAFLRQTYPSILIVMITAATEYEHVQALYAYGVFDYIVKPFQQQRLTHTLVKIQQVCKLLSQQTDYAQQQIDALWAVSPATEQVEALPKGIDTQTLERVATFFDDASVTYTATALSQHIGTSRSTARRYLEHLVERGILQTELLYGTVGRPERNYRRATYEQN